MVRSKWSLALALALVFASGIVAGALGYRYYDRYYEHKADARPKSPEEFRKAYVAEMQSRLKLSDSQVKQLEVILDETPPIRPVSAAGSTARITAYGLNEISVRARVAEPCLLVMSEIAYPDWNAEVDGAETRILTADYCLRALSLGPGDHEIRMRFSSRTLRLSLIVSIVCFGAALVPAIHGIVTSRGR